jgi:tRNA pseudouridine55 synthase
VIATADASAVTRPEIDDAIRALTGEIEQVPSSYSAIKVDGRRSYDRARAGEEVVLAARRVTVSRFDVLAERRDGEALELDVSVACSSGTYIRALARDLGAALGVGGHLTALRRTSIGPFAVTDAVTVAAIDAADLRAPAAIAAQLFPSVSLDAAQATDLAHGKRVTLEVPDAPVVAALTPGGRLAGLVSVTGGAAKVLVNFPRDETSDEMMDS